MYQGSPRQPKVEEQYDTPYTHGRLNQFIIDDVKAPLMQGLNRFGEIKNLSMLPETVAAFAHIKKLPRPCKGNTRWHNTDILIDIRDEAQALKLLPVPAFAAVPIADFAIIIYDYDPYYQERLDWLYFRLKDNGWSGDWDTNKATLEKLRAEFFALENNPGRDKAFRFIWDTTIKLYKTKRGRRFLDWAIPKLLQSSWEPREPLKPRPPCWREFQHLY